MNRTTGAILGLLCLCLVSGLIFLQQPLSSPSIPPITPCPVPVDPAPRACTTTNLSGLLLENWQEAETQKIHFCSRIFPTLESNLPPIFKVRQDVKIDGSAVFPFYCFGSKDIVCKDILRGGGGWDFPKLKAMVEHLKSVSTKIGLSKEKITFLDIGANVGWFSATILAAGFRVISFEPMAQNEVLIRLNQCSQPQSVRDRWTFFNKGLGPKTSTCLLISDDNNVGDGHSICDTDGYSPPNGYSIRGQVDIVRLDDYINSTQLNEMEVGLVKIDVEGFEGEVMKGGKNFFADPRVKYVVMEIWRKNGRLTDGHKVAYDYLLEVGFKASHSFTDRIHMGPEPSGGGEIFDIFFWKE